MSRPLSIGCVLVLSSGLAHCGHDPCCMGTPPLGGAAGDGGASGNGAGGFITNGVGGSLDGGATSNAGSGNGNGGSTIFVGVPPEPRGGARNAGGAAGNGGDPIFVGVPIQPQGGRQVIAEGGRTHTSAGTNDGGATAIEYGGGAGGVMGIPDELPGGAGQGGER